MNDVLLVDDDPDFMRMCRLLLVTQGLTITCAVSGEEALQELRGDSFRLTITDYHLPEMNGLILSKHMCSIAPGMPIIMVTGSMTPELSYEAKSVGISTVLAKPFFPDTLLNEVGKLLEVQLDFSNQQ